MPTRYAPLSVGTEGETDRVAPPQRAYRGGVSPVSPWYFKCNCFDPVIAWAREHLPIKAVVGYTAGALFTLGWWAFIDSVIYSGSHDPPLPVAIKFEDWVPGLLSTVSLIMVNLIDKTALNATEFTHDGSYVAFKARLWAFLGVTMALGALGGSLAIMSLKYIIPGYTGEDAYGGFMIVAQNVLIFAGSMLFWFGRNSGEPELQLGF
ncbi:hypothetical protein DFJ74DRAFT_691586 [Hyaloraphidium curvatum]|nr:hypothetical protein DFJ74DRAFT_691586 [Hyaloraphidium curvatum]